MKQVWLKWAMLHHSFSNIILSSQEYERFSEAAQEYMEKERDEHTGSWVYSLQSLKYAYPAKPKPNEKPKPLSPDEKLQNDLFLTCAKKKWKEIKKKREQKLMKVMVMSCMRCVMDLKTAGSLVTLFETA